MLNEIKKELNYTTTENGAIVNSSTLNDVLDFYSVGGALRNRTDDEIINLFRNAYLENPLLAMKAAFYIRDARQGQGERRTFRVILRHLANKEPKVVEKNLELIAEYGRYDDLYELVGTKSENLVADYIRKQFKEDMNAEYPSLLGKWLKSENASSTKTRELGKWTAEKLGLTPRQYRKALTELRKKLNIVETAMSSGQWSEIDYAKVPSKALLQYRNAFAKHDGERFQEYNDSVATGEVKINANLMPYELVRKVVGTQSYVSKEVDELEAKLLDNLWANIPDFTSEVGENALAVADLSDSMTWEQNALALHASIGLAMYMGERATGPYKDHFLTFADNPSMVKIRGTGFVERVKSILSSEVGYSTNLEAVFDLILNIAVKHSLKQDQIVDKLYIITDMEFNSVYRSSISNTTTFMESMKEKFAVYGYELPTVVFINVNARNTHFPVTQDESGIYMVSGMSPTIFKAVLNNKTLTAYEMMLEVLNNARYDAVRV